MCHVIFLYQQWGLHVVDWFPDVITFRVPFPLDQVLCFVLSLLMGLDGLYFVLCFPLDHVRQWPHEVLAMFFCFVVGCKEQGVENGVYVPLGWKS